MSTLPIISIKSKTLQEELGVKSTRSARAKLLKFGATLIDGEFVSMKQIEELVQSKLKQYEHTPPNTEDWTTGTSFEGI